MPNIPSLSFTLKKELFTPRSLSFVGLLAFLYILFSLFILNNQLIVDTFISSTPLVYKIVLFTTLFQGLFTAFSPSDTVIMLVSSIFVGVNLVLTAKTIYLLEHQGKIRLSVGGATLISLITTGCSSCGFSLLSILGLGTSLSFLPFRGMELHVLALAMLIFSSWYMVKKLRDGKYCKR